MNYLRLFFLIVVLTFQNICAAPSAALSKTKSQNLYSDPTTWIQVVHYAQTHFHLKGTLVRKSDGYCYLKVDNRYIKTLYKMLNLKNHGYEQLPYFRTHDAPGAHISVFYVEENITPSEVGQIFHFRLKKFTLVQPSHDKHYFVLEVESPQLENLRNKYGLSPKLFGHEYHISIAKKTIRNL